MSRSPRAARPLLPAAEGENASPGFAEQDRPRTRATPFSKFDDPFNDAELVK